MKNNKVFIIFLKPYFHTFNNFMKETLKTELFEKSKPDTRSEIPLPSQLALDG